MKDGDFVKKTRKILLVLIITFLIVCIFNETFALNPDMYEPTDPTVNDAKTLTDKIGVVLGSIRNISVIISVISLMIIGLKYIFGSVEEKANYKATIFPYIIGVVLVASGTTIVSFIYNAVH